MRDVTLEDTIYLDFTTRAFASGIPTALLGSPVLSVLEENNATPITAGVSVSVSRASVAGLNMATVVATAANGYESGKGYSVYISTGTVDGVSVVGEVVGHFTIQASAAAVDLANGTDGLGALKTGIDAIPTTAMRGTDSAALASVCTEGRLAELDAANLPADVDAIPTTAMRGTDSAALASVCTEGRLAELDAANLPADIAAVPTVAEILTTAMTEAYNAEGAAPTVAEALHLIIAYLMERSVSSTTVTAKKLDGSTPAATFTLNSATSPTSVTRET